MAWLSTLYHRVNYLIYFLSRYHFSPEFKTLRKLKIHNNEETLQYILQHRVSVSRYGDGEFSLLAGHSTGFQKENRQIAEKLREILVSSEPNHIVCVPYPFKSFKGLKYNTFEYWSSYLLGHFATDIKPFIDERKDYYDTQITRFYIDYRSDRNARRVVPLLKQLWDGKKLVIVEGELSRLGVGNDLFANAASIERVICPSTNAFDVYDDIISTVKAKVPKDALILIALGMTATCLAYDLSKNGYWALDVGHVDVEYEWFRMKARKRVALPNKYVAETKERFVSDGSVDSAYQSQIIAKVVSHA